MKTHLQRVGRQRWLRLLDARDKQLEERGGASASPRRTEGLWELYDNGAVQGPFSRSGNQAERGDEKG